MLKLATYILYKQLPDFIKKQIITSREVNPEVSTNAQL